MTGLTNYALKKAVKRTIDQKLSSKAEQDRDNEVTKKILEYGTEEPVVMTVETNKILERA